MTTPLFQHGTLALLVPGLLDGTLTMADLLTHGDTGIGTGEGLDGELIILAGVPYQIDSTGRVNHVPDDFTLPFANSHFAAFMPLMTATHRDRRDLQAAVLAQTHSANTFFALRLTGTLTALTTRAVPKSARPYQSLAATAKRQSVFSRERTTGTLLSYYAPQVFDGVAVGGFHSHFLAADHAFGGHVLDFATFSGDVAFQQFDRLEQQLPTQNQAFMTHDFSHDAILDDIHHAEN